ncbi:MAG: hypothetical protein AB1Z66_12840, partial [Candidatus Limnocylindrales bacterium]
TTTLPALAQEEEAGLCRVIDIAVVAEMTGQQYEPTPFWDFADNCKYLATSNPDGNHYVRLHLDGLATYERFREGSRDPVDLEIGGRPAFTTFDDDPRGWLNTQVAVDLGDVTLRATLIADEGAVVDQMDDTVRLAEMALASLDDEGAIGLEATEAQPGAASDVTPIDLPAVDGIEWDREYQEYGADALESDSAPLGLDVFLAAIDADASRLGTRGVDARDVETDDLLGGYLALRVAGADAEGIEEAALVWIAALLDVPEAPVSDASLDGFDVLVVAPPEGMSPLYVYAEGDTVHLISTPEAVAARILAALP